MLKNAGKHLAVDRTGPAITRQGWRKENQLRAILALRALQSRQPDGPDRDMNVRERSREVAKTLRRYVVGRIASGQLQAGDKLPTEREMVEMFGGGRSTVRKALEALEKDGLIGREVGRGTFVKQTKGTSAGHPTFAH